MQAIQQALAFYSIREWGKAEQVCRTILAAQAAHFDALNLLGIITAQTQRPQEAVTYFGKAASLKRNEPTVHNNYGNVLRDLGRHEEALRSYNRAVQLNPNYAEAHYNRGLTLHGLKRFEDALRSYDRAIKLKPDYAVAFNNRGATLRELKRLDEAVQSYDRAIVLKPDYASACNNRGVALQELKRPADALESYARALALSPDYAEAFYNQANALRDLKRFDEALVNFDRALKIDPSYADAYNGLGTTLQCLNRQEGALESFDRAIAINPQHADAFYNRGNTLKSLNLHQHALDSYERALALKPDFADDHYNRGTVLHELGRYDEALQSFRRALENNPDQPWLHGICLHAKMRVCDWSGLDTLLADLTSRVEQGRPASPPFAIVTLSDSLALQQRAAQVWVQENYPARSQLPALAKRERHEKIRIGYFSADYYNHATALLAAGLFEKHDRNRFEIVGFDFGPGERDAMTARVAAAFEQFVDVRPRTDVEIASLARELGIDIAVDLKGFTLHQRAGIFAHRAAPIQVNYLGYPGTMGTPFIDYLVADETLIPPEARAYYTEKIAYLPGSYQVNDRSRPIAEQARSRADFGLPSASFVFCSFNNVYKITPAVFDCWMRILRRVTGSVLWLLDDNATATRNLRHAAGRAGVDPNRLVFSERLLAPDHLARHRLADLFIDTFPCNAHTTASDSLWAGLPVLTYAGDSFPARVAASLLNAVELPELVTTTLAQYEELAVELAMDAARLSALTTVLGRNRLTAPLFDTELFARRLEDAYTQMYERYQAGAGPECIFVR
jgi:predicted O-linked N-acetylglucosamine transferase (SPINDLY family)